MKPPTVWRICGAILVIAGCCISYAVAMRQQAAPVPAMAEQTVLAESGPDGDFATEVSIPAASREAAGLHSSAVKNQRIRQTRTVPGRIDYRSIQRVDLKAPVESLVLQVLVKPGDPVHPGTRLAVLSSPEVGLIRAEVEMREAELSIAAKACDWANRIAQHLEELLAALKAAPRPREVELQFEHKLLGDHRQKVLGAYARYILADQLNNDVQPLAASGSISRLTLQTREADREVAIAEFRAVCEQSMFEAAQQREKAQAGREYAQRLVEVSRQKLKMLLGAFTEVPTTSPGKPPGSAAVDSQSGELTRYYVISPLQGTVEQRSAAPEQRVPSAAPLFVVANTGMMEVAAEIRERDWQALSLKEGQPLSVSVPALGGRELVATVDYVGAAIAPASQAVPLVALLENPQHLLKPGMFVWVALPVAMPSEALAVPSSAVLTHAGKTFVFVEDAPGSFRRVNVTTGAATEQWIAVKGGLRLSEKVVDRGAFLLKSKLLLESLED